MDEKKESKIPAWLQDKKKLIILIIIVILMIVNGITKLVLGITIANNINSYINGNAIQTTIINKFVANLTGKKLSGAYMNDYADEILIFNKDGSLNYVVSGYEETGEYTVDNNTLTLTIGENVIILEIVSKKDDKLELSNGFTTFTFTKVENIDY